MLQPIGDLVYFKFLPFDKSDGGIEIPNDIFPRDLRASKICLGQAIAVGPKVAFVKPGNYFLFHEFAIEGADKFIKNQNYFIKEKEIIGIVEKKDVFLRNFIFIEHNNNNEDI